MAKALEREVRVGGRLRKHGDAGPVRCHDERVKRAVNAAMRWFEKHQIRGYKVVRTGTRGSADYDTRLVEDPDAPPLWARFYDLERCEPFVCDRDGIPRRHLSEIGSERRNHYSWYNNRPAMLFPLYEAWIKQHMP